MKTSTRLILATAASLTLSPIAQAQTYPTKPVHLIVGFAAGGPLDTSARLIAQALSERLGQQFIVENRPGASSNLAAEQVVRAPHDGYTLLICAAANSWNASLYDKISFDFVRDIAPVASYALVPGVMEVNPMLPAKSVPEFIAYAKANPGEVRMASAGPGSAPGMYGALFNSMAGVALLTVNYRGSAPALPDLIAGRLQVMFDLVTSSIGHIRAGKLRALGVTTATRLSVLPDVPPIADFLPGYEAIGWNGICAPKDTSSEIITILNTQVNAAVADPTFRSRLASLGAEPFVAGSASQFGQFLTEYTGKWGKLIRTANIKAE